MCGIKYRGGNLKKGKYWGFKLWDISMYVVDVKRGLKNHLKMGFKFQEEIGMDIIIDI